MQCADKENRSDETSRSSMKLESMSPQGSYDPFSVASSSTHHQSLAPSVPEELSVPFAPYIEQNEFPVPTMSVDYSQVHFTQQPVPSMSPPMTPPSLSPKVLRRSFSEPTSPSPKAPQPIIPPSPYNPLLTPSFRHNPPRLPSDQPWRFPSPSHPLHSRARELCLGMLAQGEPSPSTKIVTVVDSSPARLLNTPTIFPHKTTDGSLLDCDNADHLDSSPSILRPSSRSLFGQSPFSDHGGYRSRADESPVTRIMRRKNHSRQKSTLSSFSEVSQRDWFSTDFSSSSFVGGGGSDHHGLGTPIRLESEDPFAGVYDSWVKEFKSALNGNVGDDGGRAVAAMLSPGTESPVLRSSQSQNEPLMPGESSHLVGLGLGLLGPFTFSDEDYQQAMGGGTDDVDPDADFNLAYPPSPEEQRRCDGMWANSRSSELQTAFSLRRVHTVMMAGHDTTQGAKTDMNGLNEPNPYDSPAPPMKRRRTTIN